MTKYLLIGASVARIAAPQLHARIPGLQLEVGDGRSWITRDSLGGPTLWESFGQHYLDLVAGDWLIVDHGHGGVWVDVNRACLDGIVSRLPASVGLALVQPHTYYGVETTAMQAWNRDMNTLQRDVIAERPNSVQVWWSSSIRQATAANPQLPLADRNLGTPYLYDGRHPTLAGAAEYARLVAWCVGIR